VSKIYNFTTESEENRTVCMKYYLLSYIPMLCYAIIFPFFLLGFLVYIICFDDLRFDYNLTILTAST
jgi:hypothetical protein